MNDLPFHLLEHLASEEEQLRYIKQATKDEYLVPDELLNDGWHFCERALRPEIASVLSDFQRETVECLQKRIKNAPDDAANDAPHGAYWVTIRNQAQSVLEAFGKAVPK